MINRDNLKKLADYLLSLPDNYNNFSMWQYFEHRHHDVQNPAFAEAEYLLCQRPLNECGAVACAVGHGPEAQVCGVENFLSHSRRVVDWNAYCNANFVQVQSDYESYLRVSDEYAWLFDGDWAVVDNSAKGAAKRILYFLDHGVPEGFNHRSAYSEYTHLYKDYPNA